MKSKVAKVTGVVIAILVLSFLLLFQNRERSVNEKFGPARISAGPDRNDGLAANPLAGNDSKPVEEVEEEWLDPLFSKTKIWLDSFSPKLTLEEENELLETYGRTPSALIALASMNAERAEAYLEEALSTYPNDPAVVLFAYENHHLLSRDQEELIKTLQESAPDDSLPNIILADLLLKKGDNALARTELLNAYNKSSTLLDTHGAIYEERLKLLLSAGRTETQAIARASAVNTGSATHYGTIFAHVHEIIGDQAFDEDDQKLAALLIDTSQQLQASSTVEDSQFLLWQEEQLLKKFGEISSDQLIVEFPAHPSTMAEDVQEEIRVQELYANQSRALVPMMGLLPDDARAIFLKTYDEQGELHALQWVETNSPDVFKKIKELDIERWVGPAYWR